MRNSPNRKQNNLILLTSYILLFSVLVFVSVISIIYKNIYKVNAQLDIQTISPTLAPTEISVGTPGTPTATLCPDPDTLENKRKVKNITLGQFQGLWYAYRENSNLKEGQVLKNIEEIRRQTDSRSWPKSSKYFSSLSTKERRDTTEFFNRIGSRGCPIGLTGVSPTIFTYSPNTKVQPLAPILYLEQNSQYLYYEYDSTNISFNKPKEGWVVDKEDLVKFSNNLSDILRLTSIEYERLLFELNFSAVDVKSEKLYIGLIPQEEINEKL